MSRPTLSPAVVIADAADLADEAGLDAVSLSAVARRLGVQTPSLYSHVRDLAALRDGITALAFVDIAERISQEVAGRSGHAALHGLATAYRLFATESPGRWQALQRRAGVAVVESGAATALVALNDAVLRDYALSSEYRVHATRLIGSTINGFLALERVGSFDHSAPLPGASWTAIIDGLDILLRTWSHRTESS